MYILEVLSDKILARGHAKKQEFKSEYKATEMAHECFRGFYTHVKYWDGEVYHSNFNAHKNCGCEIHYFNSRNELVGKVYKKE